MASAKRKLIFNKPEDGVRITVLATDMAEANITINDIVFVVDCGKVKETFYDSRNNTPCLLPIWTSNASARQRTGRARRVQPGECYHLSPKCVHDAFSDYQFPDFLGILYSRCVCKSKVYGLGVYQSSCLRPCSHQSCSLAQLVNASSGAEVRENAHLWVYIQLSRSNNDCCC